MSKTLTIEEMLNMSVRELHEFHEEHSMSCKEIEDIDVINLRYAIYDEGLRLAEEAIKARHNERRNK